MKENTYYLCTIKNKTGVYYQLYTVEKITKLTYKVISHELQSSRGRKKDTLGFSFWYADIPSIRKFKAKLKLKPMQNTDAKFLINNGKLKA